MMPATPASKSWENTMSPWLNAILAGVMYGSQPFIFGRAGLSPARSAFVVESFTLVVVAIAVWHEGISDIFKWPVLWAVLSGCIGGLAWLLFASLVKQVPQFNLPNYVTVMVMCQIGVYATMRISLTGFSWRAVIGYTAALVAAAALGEI